MKENSFTCYAKVLSVRPPVPAGENARGEPIYHMTTILGTICGTVYEDGKMNPEQRQVEAIFNGISRKQIDLIAPNSDIFVHGANVITIDMDQVYRKELYGILSDPQEEYSRANILKNMAFALSASYGKSYEDVYKALESIIPVRRKKTIVRIKNGEWALKASERQLQNAIMDHDAE